MIPHAFDPPSVWSCEQFQLQVLSPQHAAQDYAAVCGSAPAIRHVFGPDNNWPEAAITFEENLRDLTRHEQEFFQRVAFAYAMLDPRNGAYLGCVYIKPIKSRIEGDLRKSRFQAQVFFWLSSLHCVIDAAQTLSTLKSWMATDWPFAQVAFPGREINWRAWEAMAHAAPKEIT